MKNLEELDFNFCLYVLKKYAIAVIVAIVVSGGLMMAYSARKKSADDSRKVVSYSTSFRLKVAYENMKRNFSTSSKSGSGTLELILKDPEKTGRVEIVEAMGLIALHSFKSAVEEEFFKRTGKRIVLDNKIIAQNDSIVKLNNMRKNLSMELLGKDGCMSDFISFAEANQPDLKEALMLRKVKICNNIERLALLNNQNVELIKHGIIITDKMLETIVNAFAPQGSIYNGAGKTTDKQDLDMWTVNEEV